MFIGHPEAGGRSAALYTVLISALNHGVDPQAYLKEVIERLPAMRAGEPRRPAAGREAINAWLTLRRSKARRDNFEDIPDEVPPPNLSESPPTSATGSRRPKQKYQRIRSTSGTEPEADRYAQALNLLPPITLADAERNYRALIQESHPDHQGDSPEATAESQLLNDAIEFFRKSLG